jgi:hypothetical protein
MNADPRWMNGRRHEVTPTPQNRYGHPPAELAEDYHALLAVGDAAASRFGTRVLAAALILAAIAAAVVFGG